MRMNESSGGSIFSGALQNAAALHAANAKALAAKPPAKPAPSLASILTAPVAAVSHAVETATGAKPVSTKAAGTAALKKALLPPKGKPAPTYKGSVVGGVSAAGGGSGLGAILGSILAPIAAPVAHVVVHDVLPEVGKIAKPIGSDLVNLPGNTLNSAEGLGASLIDDLTHGRLGVLNYGPMAPGGGSETGHLLTSAWHQSVLGHLASGDVPGAVKTFAQHPLYGAQELAGEYGLLGRGLGAAARSGALGDTLAAAGGIDREPLAVVPGLAGDVQHYSKNLFTKAAQKGIEKHPDLEAALNGLKGKSPTRLLQKRVDELVATSAAREQAAVHDIAQKLHDEKPQSKIAANIVPHAAMGIAGGPDEFVHQLEHTILPRLRAAHDSLSPAAQKANEAHQANIQAFIAHPDVQAAMHAGQAYAERQNALDHQLADQGLLNSSQAERRALEPYAQMQMGAKIIPDKSVPTMAALDARLAARQLADAKKAVNTAEKNHVKLTSMHGDAERRVAQANVALERARTQEAQTRGFITGRQGEAALAPAEGPLTQGGFRFRAVPSPETGVDLTRPLAERLDRNMTSTDAAAVQRMTMADALKAARAERKQAGLAEVTAARENFKGLREEFAKIHKPYLNKKFGGLVIEDPGAPLITRGEFKGERLRQVTNAEIKDHMDTNGVPYASYVKLNTPAEKTGIFDKWRLGRSRGGSGQKRYTGAALPAGAFNPGYGALAKSQIGSVSKLQRALSNDEFVRRFGITKPGGEYFTPHEAIQAAKSYGHDVVPMAAHPAALDASTSARIHNLQDPGEAAHMAGVKGFESRRIDETSPDKGHVVLVPKAAHDRYLAHMELSAKPARGIGAINRQFRNTVLPFSPKWLAGNVIEAGLRSALVGAGPRDAQLAGRVIKQMRAEGLNDQADHLERMATGGLHYGMQQRLNMEAIGMHDTSDMGRIRRGAQAAMKPYTGLVQGIFSFNRHLESAFEQAVLGAHMKAQMQEFAGTWLKTVGAQDQYLSKLAHGYADPAMAADAGRYVHETLGQYDRFSPQMKRFVRSIAPFAPWYINAAKFVYYTLPLKHPLVQSALLDVNRPLSEHWSADHNVPHGTDFGLPTGDLLNSVRTGDGSFLNLGRYTPEGAFTSGPLNYATSMLAPQFSGALNNIRGQDEFGNDLKYPNGTKVTDAGRRAEQALNSLLESFGGPTYTLNRIVREHGSTPYNTSTLLHTLLKPNTHHGGPFGVASRALWPFEPTYLKKVQQSGAAVSGGPRAVGSGPRAVGSGPRAVGSGPRAVGSGSVRAVGG